MSKAQTTYSVDGLGMPANTFRKRAADGVLAFLYSRKKVEAACQQCITLEPVQQ